VAYGKYAPPLSDLVERFKFGSRTDLASVIAPLYHRLLAPMAPAVLIPVPASRKGRRSRGFDQMKVVCNVMVRRYGYLQLDLLGPAGRGEQKFLDRRQRQGREGYRIEGDRHRQVAALLKRGYRFFLVDDIATTGRTVFRCRELLRDTYRIEATAIVLALA
jgi:predicted amidophosphoribosyltransferase